MGLLNTDNKTNTIHIEISSLRVVVRGEVELLKNLFGEDRYPKGPIRSFRTANKIKERLDVYGPEILFFPDIMKEFITKEIGTEKIYARHGNQHWTMRYTRYTTGPGENKSVGIKIMSPGDRVSMVFDVGVVCDLDTFSYLVHLKTTYTL